MIVPYYRACQKRLMKISVNGRHKIIICDALRDLVAFVQFKKRESTHRAVLLLVKLQATTHHNDRTIGL